MSEFAGTRSQESASTCAVALDGIVALPYKKMPFQMSKCGPAMLAPKDEKY